MSKNIIVIGSCNTDMVIKADRLPVPGETIIGGSFMMNPGGKGANQAVAAARLKGNVHFIAKTGNDLFGKRSIEQYEDEGIHVENIYSDPTLPSGVALIMVDMNGENSIAIASGANGSLSPEDIRKAQSTIEKGDIFGIIGFSGAGKSTLLRMINALEVPTSGHVEIDGVNINGLSFNELRKVRKRIGMVFQQFNLLNAKSVYDNVAIPLILNKVPKSEIDKKVKTLLDFVDLGDKANAYPGELSGGQKQRVGIARALATDPSILLCDEATSALDPDTTESILQLLERVNRELGVTVVIVTHEIDVIQKICNRVVVMEHGKLIESGSVLEVFSKPKHETTKRFVRTVIPDEIPSTVKHTLACDKRPYTILKMHFLGNNTTDNVLYHINKIFDLETSVLFATVTELEHTVLGIFIVQFIGDDLEVGKVKEYLVTQGIEWQEVAL